MLTQSRLRAVVQYDPGTGVFTWKTKTARHIVVGAIAGRTRRDGYMRIGIDGTRYLAHRVAWLYVHGEWPREDIDHINGDPTDNRIANLRACSRSENLMNQGPHKNNKSGHKGVFWDNRRRRWTARASLRGKQIHIGAFHDINAAAAAYQAFVREHHGEFAKRSAA